MTALLRSLRASSLLATRLPLRWWAETTWLLFRIDSSASSTSVGVPGWTGYPAQGPGKKEHHNDHWQLPKIGRLWPLSRGKGRVCLPVLHQPSLSLHGPRGTDPDDLCWEVNVCVLQSVQYCMRCCLHEVMQPPWSLPQVVVWSCFLGDLFPQSVEMSHETLSEFGVALGAASFTHFHVLSDVWCGGHVHWCCLGCERCCSPR